MDWGWGLGLEGWEMASSGHLSSVGLPVDCLVTMDHHSVVWQEVEVLRL